MTGPLRLDLHVHSVYSPDGRAAPAELVARAHALGLHGLALTDHNSVRGTSATETLARAIPGFLFVPGVEVSTADGHLLAFGLRSVPPPGQPLATTVDWVRAHAGEPVLAHPLRWFHGVGGAAVQRSTVGAIEVVNGHTGSRHNRGAAALAAERRLGGTGGSDAHRAEELGRAVTVFPDGLRTTDDLLEAIRRGRTVGEGSSLDVSGQLRTSLRSALLRAARGFRSI
jgi:predicted metal-dependent phosphoesterase TrpH